MFFALLLAGRAAVFFDYNGELAIKIKYLCFTVVKIPKKKKKPKKTKKKADKKDKKVKAAKDDKEVCEEETEKISDKKKSVEKQKKDGGKKPVEKKKKLDLKSLTLNEKIELLKRALSNIGKPLKKLLKRIKFSHMSIGIVCGGDDAAKTAIKFGAMNIAVGNVLGLLDSFFTLKPLDDMNITADFQSEETIYDIYFEVRLSLFAGLVGAIGLLKALLKAYNEFKRIKAQNDRKAERG